MATGKFLFMSLDVDRVLISISKYIRVLELAGDFHRERTDATDYAEVILQEAAKETVFKVDRNKWNVLRQLLELLTFKLFHTASQGSADTQRGPDGQAAQELKTNPFVRLFKSFDKIRVKDCHRGEAGTQQGQRASPAGDSRGPASPAGENASADVLDELSRKEEEVQDLRRQRDFFEGELRRSAPEIMSLREALEESKRQREYFLGQWSAEKRRLDETLGEFEKLQSEHVQLVTKLEEEREANRELHARLKKLDLVHKQQEETKELVRQISTRQEELFEEIRDIVPTADQAELERLQLPDDVRELCLKIQYFIGGNAQAFGRQLLGRHFAVEEYESEPGSCVCFATLPVFWRMVRKWRETSESGVSLEQLQSACRALTPDPTQLEPMSAGHQERLETQFTFLAHHVLVQETLPCLRDSGRLSQDARLYVEQGRGKRGQLQRLVQVLHSLGRDGFRLLLQALDKSQQFLVSRRLAACLQEENEGGGGTSGLHPGEDFHRTLGASPGASAARPVPATDGTTAASSGIQDSTLRAESLQPGEGQEGRAAFLLRVHELSVACQSVLQTRDVPNVTSSLTSSMTASWDMLRSCELFGPGKEEGNE